MGLLTIMQRALSGETDCPQDDLGRQEHAADRQRIAQTIDRRCLLTLAELGSIQLQMPRDTASARSTASHELVLCGDSSAAKRQAEVAGSSTQIALAKHRRKREVASTAHASSEVSEPARSQERTGDRRRPRALCRRRSSGPVTRSLLLSRARQSSASKLSRSIESAMHSFYARLEMKRSRGRSSDVSSQAHAPGCSRVACEPGVSSGACAARRDRTCCASRGRPHAAYAHAQASIFGSTKPSPA